MRSAEAKHNLFTHFPKDRNCEICRACKTDRAHCRKKTTEKPSDLPVPTAFGDQITADHKIINEDNQSRECDRVALVMQDRFTAWIQAYPCKNKSQHETKLGLRRFMNEDPKHIYTDNSKELINACLELGWNHDTSQPHRPATNGVAERAVRRVKEGTSCAIVQSGIMENMWHYAMETFCFLRNVVDKVDEDKTPYEKRWNEKFTGPIIPFGAEVQYKPIAPKDSAQLHDFGAKLLKGLFFGYEQRSGGGWTGQVYVVDANQMNLGGE